MAEESPQDAKSIYMSMSKESLVERIMELENKLPSISRGMKTPFNMELYHTRHIALKIAYLGFNYNGMAVQSSTPNTIEGCLLRSLQENFLIRDFKTSVFSRCGRTDKGVSACGQVVSLLLRSNYKKEEVDEDGRPFSGISKHEFSYMDCINARLPPDIRVVDVKETKPDFNARFSCQRRIYKYIFIKNDLDIESMQEGCRFFEGTYDFSNFCRVDNSIQNATYIRTLYRVSIDYTAKSVDGRSIYMLVVEGKGFLYHQIRCMMSVLLKIGKGEQKPSYIEELLDVERVGKLSGYEMASEIPLVLWDCVYDDSCFLKDSCIHPRRQKSLNKLYTRAETNNMIGLTSNVIANQVSLYFANK